VQKDAEERHPKNENANFAGASRRKLRAHEVESAKPSPFEKHEGSAIRKSETRHSALT
jgi:hypothetical protein